MTPGRGGSPGTRVGSPVVVATAAALALLAAAACHKSPPAPPPAPADADDASPYIADLVHQEDALRAATDWAAFPSSDRTLGADPVDVAALPGGGFVGVLRGADALVRLDDDGRELARVPAPRAPRAVAVDGDAVAVVGELDGRVLLASAAALGAPAAAARAGAPRFVAVAGVRGMRGVALARDRHGVRLIYVVDLDGNLLVLDGAGRRVWPGDDRAAPVNVGPRALWLKRAGGFLVSMSVLGHQLVVVPVDERGVPDGARAMRVDNDGPFWGFDARVVGASLLVAAGHVEDHPLDRSGGSFGYIDSFVSVYRFPAAAGAKAERLVRLNASAAGVVVPKALAFLDDDTVVALGAGSGRGMRFQIDGSTAIEVTTDDGARAREARATTAVAALPGIVAVAVAGGRALAADRLLDAWVVLPLDGGAPRAVPVPAPPGAPARSTASKLGEALAFTTLMAPRQKSDGELSRFTCETCHFEGGGDGRVHSTGRGDVKASTRFIQGLFNNKPLFTRALDENLSEMVHAEFRVANARSELDPWFAVTPADAPWLSLLGVRGKVEPVELRRALVSFFHDFTPRENAAVVGRTAFTAEERRGAEVFRARCASCHTPRLVGDDPRTAQPFDRWERLILSDNGPLVWSGDGRKKTGIEPYVHEDGARPSSLRRVSRKLPYFTNGSSRALADVVARARFSGSTFMHSSKRSDLAALPPADQRALVAFLELL